MSYLLIIVVLLLFLFFMPVIRVKGRSMLPTLRNGDLLIVRRWLPRKEPLKRGDVVICRYPGRYLMKHVPQSFVKRVVGLPGEWLQIRQGQLLINDAPCSQPYLDPAYAHPRGNTSRRLIGRHRYFVMGDHRDNSNDSRSVGTLHRQDVVGKVIAIIHVPLKFSEWLEKWDRKADAVLRKEMMKQHIKRQSKQKSRIQHEAEPPKSAAQDTELSDVQNEEQDEEQAEG